jgi:hypothetical protein
MGGRDANEILRTEGPEVLRKAFDASWAKVSPEADVVARLAEGVAELRGLPRGDRVSRAPKIAQRMGGSVARGLIDKHHVINAIFQACDINNSEFHASIASALQTSVMACSSARAERPRRIDGAVPQLTDDIEIFETNDAPSNAMPEAYVRMREEAKERDAEVSRLAKLTNSDYERERNDPRDAWKHTGEVRPGPAKYGARIPENAARHGQSFETQQTGTPPLTTIDFAPYAFPDPQSIPKRQHLFGRHFMRGAVGASIGAPGRLKSTTVMTEVIGMSVGRDLMRGQPLPSGPLRAAYLNGEEVQEELDRRVAAICQRFGLKAEDCGGRLWVISTRENPIRIAVRGPRGDAVVWADVVSALNDWCDRSQIDALAIDPLISFHAVRESDNADMDLVCKEAFGAIAGKRRAVELVHHPRKLPPGESNTTVDDARGASAILAATRMARTFNFMTTAEAVQLGIHEDDRRRHVRIENGKNNPGPIGKAHWVRIETENLPNGDEVACATLWKPPNPFDGVTVNDLKVVQKLVQGGAFRTDSQSPHWLGWWMAENLPNLNIKTRHSDRPRDKAEVARLKSILKTWLKNEALATEKRQDERRREREFFIVGKPIDPSPKPATESDDDQIILH